MDKNMQPQLRFKEFNGEWKNKKLNEVTNYVDYRGKTPTKTETGTLLVTAKNIKKGFIDYSTSKEYIATEEYEEVMRRGIPLKGDVLFTTEAPMGNVAQVNKEDIALAQRVIKFRGKDKLNNDYLKHYMLGNRFQNKLVRKAIGTTVLGIQGKVLHKMELPVPPLPEQEKIASFLSSVDTKIEELKEKKELLGKYKKGIMQKIFSQELRFKNENGEEYPQWEKKKLGEVAEKIKAKNQDESVKQVFTNSASQGIVNQQDYFNKDIANQNNLGGYYIVQKDDFIYNPRISILAPVGPIKRNHIGEGVMSPLYIVFRFKNVNLSFLECYFKSTFWHRYMKQIANYGARHDRMNITNEGFFKMPLLLPSLLEQEKIAEFLSEIDQKIELVEKEIDGNKEFKKGLLQQMFV